MFEIGTWDAARVWARERAKNKSLFAKQSKIFGEKNQDIWKKIEIFTKKIKIFATKKNQSIWRKKESAPREEFLIGWLKILLCYDYQKFAHYISFNYLAFMVFKGHVAATSRFNPFVPTVPTCAVRETASHGIMGAPRVPPLNPTETIVFWEHYRLWGV